MLRIYLLPDSRYSVNDLHIDMAFLVAAKLLKGVACVRGVSQDEIDEIFRRYPIDKGRS